MAPSSQESTVSECSGSGNQEECRINISTPAVVAWDAEHAKLNLHLQYDSSTGTAFFKLRDSLVLKALSPARTNLYLFIPPERIQTLTLNESPDPDSIPPTTAQLLDSTSSSLRFVLSSPADLIGPKFVALTPKNKVEGRVLDQLRSLVRAIEFNVFIPHRVASKGRLEPMCHGVNDGLTSHPGQTDLACLYEGKGGMKIAVSSAEVSTAEAESSRQPSGENLPSYSEVPQSPPLAAAGPSAPATKKRRLDDSQPVEVSADLLAMVEATCRKIVRQEVRQEIRDLEKRLTVKMEELAEIYAEKQGDRLSEELVGTSQAIDEKVEDEFYGLRVRLEEFIEEEMAEAEERVVEHLQSRASVHLEFD